MADAISTRNFGKERVLLASSISAYDVWQLPSGKAGFWNSPNAASSGSYVEFDTSGAATLTKASGFVALAGNRAYWDHSANNVSYKKVNDRDFYLGRFAEDALGTATSCVVNLNEDPHYDVDLIRDPFLSTIVGTAAAGGFGYPVRLGGAAILELTATSEAQKVDLLSVDGFAIASNPIIEGAFRVLSDGASGSQDISLGCASGTHASDFQSVAEFVALHLDGNVTDINVQSDDGTTDVAPTDSTIDYVEGSAIANRVEFWIDLRDPADAQVYINGALVLGSSTFTLAAATGPLFLIAHVEKASGTDTYKLALDWLRVHFAEQ